MLDKGMKMCIMEEKTKERWEMSLIQILLSMYFAALGAYLSILMSRILNQNGRVLKRIEEEARERHEEFRMMDKKTGEGFKKMDEGFRLIARLIVEEDAKKKREILDNL
ncbi:MAG: hypothetical protein COS84_00355 [Armatimonadetes bacterium CG07_land_8_20_14_0_80_40_9]|nr:MAG: hypothetical protein COS84_00355 [Armatimonadetes bacterium CG07_land_8_20_14_0_80_40_9]